MTAIREYKPQRLFVDIDGTLAVFTPVNELERLYEPGFFGNLKPIDTVVRAIKQVIRRHPEIEVNSLSAYLTDSPYALSEKNAWLDQFLPEIDQTHRIFLPCGTNKKDFIEGGIQPGDYLIDDYTQNLLNWLPENGIKLLNGINHTHGTWRYSRLRFDKSPEELASNIVEIIQHGSMIMDEVPLKIEKYEIKDQEEGPDVNTKQRSVTEMKKHITSNIGVDVNGSNIIIDFDQRSDSKTNGHIIILGNSGEGKSYE